MGVGFKFPLTIFARPPKFNAVRLTASVLLLLFLSYACSKKADTNDGGSGGSTGPGPKPIPTLHTFELKVKDTTATTAKIEWGAAADFDLDSIQYLVFLDGNLATSQKGGTRSFTFSNLNSDQTYTVKVKALNSKSDSIVIARSFKTKDSYLKYSKLLYENVRPTDMVIASDETYMICGDTSFNNRLVLLKADTMGNLLWLKHFDYDGRDARIVETNGGFVVLGYNYVIKVDNAGNRLWERLMPATGYLFTSLTIGANGDILVTGSEDRPLGGPGRGRKAAIFRLNASGAILWVKHYGGNAYGVTTDVVPERGGNGFFVLGELGVIGTFPDVKTDVWLLKIAQDGTIIWEKTYGDGRYDFAKRIIYNNDQLVIGTWAVDDVQLKEMRLFRVGVNGGLLNTISLKSPAFMDRFYSVGQTKDNGYVVSGDYSLSSYNFNGGFFKYNASDNKQWEKVYSVVPTDYNRIPVIKQTGDGGYVFPLLRIDNKMIGFTYSSLWLFKTNPSGSYQ